MDLTKYAPVLRLQKPDLSDNSSGSIDRKLVRRVQAGDAIAFARLFDGYAERVFGYMRFHTADDQLAEDLTARVFAKAWNRIPCYDLDRPPFGVWLHMIAREAVIDFSLTRGMESGIAEILSPTDKGLEEYEHIPPCLRQRVESQPESEPE